MLLSLLFTGTHSTAPWYVAIPIVVLALGARLLLMRSRRGRGGRGPFGRGGGPFGGSGNGQ
jgi:hypothetical protein